MVRGSSISPARFCRRSSRFGRPTSLAASSGNSARFVASGIWASQSAARTARVKIHHPNHRLIPSPPTTRSHTAGLSRLQITCTPRHSFSDHEDQITNRQNDRRAPKTLSTDPLPFCSPPTVSKLPLLPPPSHSLERPDTGLLGPSGAFGD
jgi:hypothetical protein